MVINAPSRTQGMIASPDKSGLSVFSHRKAVENGRVLRSYACCHIAENITRSVGLPRRDLLVPNTYLAASKTPA